MGILTYFSVKVRLSSQVTIGKLRRSLYVGKMTEYLSFVAAAFLGAIVVVAVESEECVDRSERIVICRDQCPRR